MKKISTISSYNTSVIFLSDLRLNNSPLVEDLKNAFLLNPGGRYDLIHHSSLNRRGVGILINKNLSYTITDRFTDNYDNILGVKLNISECELWIISVYGPNTNDREFFNTLGRLIDRCAPVPVVLGGDWNTTISTVDSPDNIDTFGMQRPPSVIRSNYLNQICTTSLLTDPFRALHPELRDFTYVPRNGRNNRSRLDFFLISDCLLNNISECYIEKSLTCSLFDHKPIYLTLGIQRFNPAQTIFNSTLQYHLFDYVVLTNVVDTYLNHSRNDTPNLNIFKSDLGRALQVIRDINQYDWQAVVQDEELPPAGRINLLARLEEYIGRLPSTEVLNNLSLTAPPDTFFEILCSNLKNELLGLQGWLKKIEKGKLTHIYAQLTRLKDNYDENHEEILRLESEATVILDSKLASKVSEMKIFENLNSERPTPIFLTLTKKKSVEKLSLIKDDNGSDFENDNLRNAHIVGTYEELYRDRDPVVIPDNILKIS
jgi:exonuclease III